uniref:Uncharacterized protein n=1 Tax=Anguilla anguilla TaxID=7936 RepID=A0A0E9UJM2_ANGAN
MLRAQSWKMQAPFFPSACPKAAPAGPRPALLCWATEQKGAQRFELNTSL